MNKYEIKREALRMLLELGITEEMALDIFYRQVVLNKGLPFQVCFPGNSTSITSPADHKETEERRSIPKIDSKPVKFENEDFCDDTIFVDLKKEMSNKPDMQTLGEIYDSLTS